MKSISEKTTLADRLLVVASNAEILRLVDESLRSDGHEIHLCSRGKDALRRLDALEPDLLLLEASARDDPGVEVCRRIRARAKFARLPIIMISGRGGEADRVQGLDAGADDYVVKPFFTSELAARVRALLRRVHAARWDTVAVGDIVLNRMSHRVTVKGVCADLTHMEFRLLGYLMDRAEQVLSREQLLSGVWEYGSGVDPRTVDVHIGRIKKALRSAGQDAAPIRTVRSSGYAFSLK